MTTVNETLRCLAPLGDGLCYAEFKRGDQVCPAGHRVVCPDCGVMFGQMSARSGVCPNSRCSSRSST